MHFVEVLCFLETITLSWKRDPITKAVLPYKRENGTGLLEDYRTNSIKKSVHCNIVNIIHRPVRH